MKTIRFQQDSFLSALYAEEALSVIDQVDPNELGAHLGFEDAQLERVKLLVIDDGYAVFGGLAGGMHLTKSGRRYVEQLEARSGQVAPTTVNHFHGPINDSQIAIGDNAAQHQTNNAIDAGQLAELVALARDFDTAELSTSDQADFAEILVTIETQLATPSVPDARHRTALEGLRAIALSATNTGAGKVLADLVTGLLL